MATGKELRVRALTLKKWADGTSDSETAEQMLRLAEKLDALAEREETLERQLV